MSIINGASTKGELIQRFSSRRERLRECFLNPRLAGAKSYDRIAGYFSSSILEVAGEAIESVEACVRVVCNSDLDRRDIETAKAAQAAVRQAWCRSEPERLLDSATTEDEKSRLRGRFGRLFDLLKSGKIEVRVLPAEHFGLIHGKAGVITLANGTRTSFIGSTNETGPAWSHHYELVWEDCSAEAADWVQEEFDALWDSPFAVPLAQAVIEDIGRLAHRDVIHSIKDWASDQRDAQGRLPALDPAPAVVEAPVYRREVGLWEHQKFFVKTVLDWHRGPYGKARFVLADQVGLGKTLQLAMAAQLIALTGDKPVLVLAPKTLLWQWQGEMLDLLDMPSAVWNGRQWVDEAGIQHPAIGAAGIRKCPRRVGVVSTGLVTARSEAAKHLLSLLYDCVILDEAHRARRKNLGDGRDDETPDGNNLLRYMLELAGRTTTLLLATATPVQIRPVEGWDLLNILRQGDDSVMGRFSRWERSVEEALELVMGRREVPQDDQETWEWVRNPMPPAEEHRDFEQLRASLDLQPFECIARGDAYERLRPPDWAKIRGMRERFFQMHHPFIRRIIRRTRQQLEETIDPETGEPFLKPIRVVLRGEGERDALHLPPYLQEGYDLAGEFCRALAARLPGRGFLKTLLLRRIGSTVYAGRLTAQKMLGSWEHLDEDDEDELDEDEQIDSSAMSKTLTQAEIRLLERLIASLESNQERDPKVGRVIECLRDLGWLEIGCIVFSQYRDSIQWLAEQLTEEFPGEPIAIYSGPTTSGIMRDGIYERRDREELKALVRRGQIRLMLGTDAASEGLNLQRLARLINLDLPWNPTRLEQRKGRIQRIGQIHDTVEVYNLRYRGSVEDRVHELLSERLQDIHDMFGQIPDVVEDAWIEVALGNTERAKQVINQVPRRHPFEVRYQSAVGKLNWESCATVLAAHEKRRVLSEGWV